MTKLAANDEVAEIVQIVATADGVVASAAEVTEDGGVYEVDAVTEESEEK